jgi:hypothetical protein
VAVAAASTSVGVVEHTRWPKSRIAMQAQIVGVYSLILQDQVGLVEIAGKDDL